MSKLLDNYKWICAMYVMQGVPFALITVVAPVLFKNFNYNNADIAFYTSLWMLPWILKFLVAPALEKFNQKHLFLTAQIMLVTCIFLVALSFQFEIWYIPVSILFTLIAILGAIYDINSDGFYLNSLTYQEQAKFVGVRSICYQIGKLICRFGVLFIVGYFSITYGKEQMWGISFFLLSLLLLGFIFYLNQKLPAPPPQLEAHDPYRKVITLFFQLPKLIPNIIFILFFEFPEAQLSKIIPLFMMDSISSGGLGLTIQSVSLIYGAFSMISMLLGMTIAGIILNKYSLKQCLIPFSIINVFSYMSLLILFLPHSLYTVIICITFAGFAFGLGNGAYMLYLVRYFSQTTHSMSLYTIGTVIMLLGMMIGGSISGFLQTLLGYQGFFQWIIMLAILIVFLTIYHVKKVMP